MIRKDLIEKELNHLSIEFYELQLNNDFIEKLFENYYVQELTEHFYDSGPEYDEDTRLSVNTWIEIYVEDVWNLTQEEVDAKAREYLEEISYRRNCKGRLYIGKDENLFIYFYGRDEELHRDLWWSFKKKTKE